VGVEPAAGAATADAAPVLGLAAHGIGLVGSILPPPLRAGKAVTSRHRDGRGVQGSPKPDLLSGQSQPHQRQSPWASTST
jgi:hypothetical protein